MRPDIEVIAVLHEGAFDRPAHSIDRPQRLVWLMQALGQRSAALKLHSEAATLDDLAAAHEESYVNGLRLLSERGYEARLDPELIVGPGSYEAAAHAAGAVLAEARALLQAPSRDQLIVCLSRPGSHHAGPDYGMGFCLFNNLAVAAARVIAEGLAERVAILDFDAHHGNGTQDIFRDNEQVLTVSMHAHPFYPGTGGGQGEAIADINCPINASTEPDSVWSLWKKAMREVVEFRPQLILVEAGVDGHRDDWTTPLQLDGATFGQIGQELRHASIEADAPLLLEAGGGYTEKAVLGGMSALLRGLGA